MHDIVLSNNVGTLQLCYYSRYCIAQNFCGFPINFAETMFADAINVTPNVHNSTKFRA